MRCRSTILLIALLTLTICSLAPAQYTQSNAGYVLPWNGLAATRAAGAYQTIIGATGTHTVPGSGTALPQDSTFTLPLPFAVHFLATTYPAGYNVHASVAGFLSFAPTTTHGTWPYLLMPDPDFNLLIMPFWSDLKTTGTIGEGLYHRVTVDSASGDSIWTIEWSVETMSAPKCSGRFQLRLIQEHVPTTGELRTEIRFEYDPTTPLNRAAPPGWYGAQVGIKNFGQDIGLPQPLGGGADDAKFLLMTYPGAVIPYNVAITRLPTRRSGATDYVPDWYANVVSPSSSFFHYTTPDSSYRMKPIDADAACIRDPLADPFTCGAVYPKGTVAPGSVMVANLGFATLLHVPVHIMILTAGLPPDTATIMVDTIPPLDTALVTISLPVSVVGEHHARAWIALAGDQDPTNDSTFWTYYVTPKHDGMPASILSPLLVDELSPARYTVGTPIPITASLANSGTSSVKSFIAGYNIRNAADSIVAHKQDTIAGSMIPPGTLHNHGFGYFFPHAAGLYRIDLYCFSSNDSLANNDTLHSIPFRDWISHGGSPNIRGVVPIPFELFDSVELAVGTPERFPHLPHVADTISGTTNVMAMVLNNGGTDVTNLPVEARITDANDSLLYDYLDTIAMIPSGRRVRSHYFADFTPPHTGNYCVTVLLHLATPDANPATDTVTWCFVARVRGDLGGLGGGRLSLLEAPSGGAADASGSLPGDLPIGPAISAIAFEQAAVTARNGTSAPQSTSGFTPATAHDMGKGAPAPNR